MGKIHFSYVYNIYIYSSKQLPLNIKCKYVLIYFTCKKILRCKRWGFNFKWVHQYIRKSYFFFFFWKFEFRNGLSIEQLSIYIFSQNTVLLEGSWAYSRGTIACNVSAMTSLR